MTAKQSSPQAISGAEVTIERMYYTLCRECGALNDWSETFADARRKRKEHLASHAAPKTEEASR